MYRGASTQLLINFAIRAGVREGRLVSGSLFALAFHGLLAELATVGSLDGARVAFRCGVFVDADDMAVAVANFWTWIRRAGPILDAFAMPSALRLKPSKSISRSACSSS